MKAILRERNVQCESLYSCIASPLQACHMPIGTLHVAMSFSCSNEYQWITSLTTLDLVVYTTANHFSSIATWFACQICSLISLFDTFTAISWTSTTLIRECLASHIGLCQLHTDAIACSSDVFMMALQSNVRTYYIQTACTHLCICQAERLHWPAVTWFRITSTL